MSYKKFIRGKERKSKVSGFDAEWIPQIAFDWQEYLINWACKKGRSALFEECGCGKTIQQIAFAQNVLCKTNKPALILAPLAVGEQTCREGEKIGIDINHTKDGTITSGLNISNYERLHYFNKDDFSCVVLDESSIIKNFAGKFRDDITTFMKDIPYRLLCTATPSPNDFMELGTSAEALSEMRRVEMLSTFFTHDSKETQKWILKGHGEKPFWQWLATWSRAIRRPSDIGFDNGNFILPSLDMVQHTVNSKTLPGKLFVTEAKTLDDQRSERKDTAQERCQVTADIANNTNNPFLAWCSFNYEADLLHKLIPGSVNVQGSDKDTVKEQKLMDFSKGNTRVMITKPSIAGFGLNWQHCADMSFFPSHSHEQFYQSVRRCWRFGQSKDVTCNIITSEAESAVLDNMRRKEKQAEELFNGIISGMHDYQTKDIFTYGYKPLDKMEIPKWLK